MGGKRQKILAGEEIMNMHVEEEEEISEPANHHPGWGASLQTPLPPAPPQKGGLGYMSWCTTVTVTPGAGTALSSGWRGKERGRARRRNSVSAALF